MTSCFRKLPSRVRATQGSCETTCDTYDYCKGNNNARRHQICIAECRSIFSEDGLMDESGLLGLQGLACPDLLAFIEGNDSREIGTEKLH